MTSEWLLRPYGLWEEDRTWMTQTQSATGASSKRRFIRFMRRCVGRSGPWTYLGRKIVWAEAQTWGRRGGDLCLWGPERVFSLVRNAQCTHSIIRKSPNKEVRLFPGQVPDPNRRFRIVRRCLYYCYLERIFHCQHQSRSSVKKMSADRVVCETTRQRPCESCDRLRAVTGAQIRIESNVGAGMAVMIENGYA